MWVLVNLGHVSFLFFFHYFGFWSGWFVRWQSPHVKVLHHAGRGLVRFEENKYKAYSRLLCFPVTGLAVIS